jgi:TldD protein
LNDRLKETVDFLKTKGVDYADVRYVHSENEIINVKNNQLGSLANNESRGVGIRVLYKGCWGFAAGSDLTGAGLRKTAVKAVNIAKASLVTRKKKVKLAPVPVYIDRYESPYIENPFEVPLDEKIGLLMEITKKLGSKKKIKTAEADLAFYKTNKIFCSSEGSFIEQTIIESGGGFSATAVDRGEVQRRSYPSSFRGDYQCAGYEFVRAQNMIENCDRVADEAYALLKAPDCPSKESDIIILGGQLALQIHESCGHPIELDRVLGTEISLAGGSFMTVDKLGKLKYGSKAVNIVQDSTIKHGLGGFGYDDEGVKSSRTNIIKNGRFVGYLGSRETAAAAKMKPNGTMRADGWSNIPLIRMTNINLEPGKWDYNDLIADTKDAIIFDMNKSWSIDDKRLNFQFGVEAAWQVKNGKIKNMYKNGVYTGITPEFWNSCDAVCNKKYWRVWGIPSCGKGEPMQTAHVAHGASPTRFRNVKVGASK